VPAKEQPALLAAYVAVGTDELKAARVFDRMDKRLVECGGDLDFDREVFEGPKTDDAALLRSSLDLLPFGSEMRLVVVRDVDKAPKTVTEAIVSYLEHPNPTTVLLMSASKLAKTTRLYKAVDKLGRGAIIDCAPKKARDLVPQVVDMARPYGVSLDFEAAQALVSLLGESTMLIDSELRKLAGMYPGSRLSAEVVRANVSRVAPYKPWDFTDCVAKRDATGAMAILAQTPPGDIYGLFLQTVGTLRELLCAKVLSQRGRMGELAQQVGALRGRPVQDWQLKGHVPNSRRFSLQELRQALISAGDCDAALKSNPDKETVFTRWLLSFCAASR
jgi:DNA polymerase III subunit delta